MTEFVNNIADLILLSSLIPLALFSGFYITRSPFEVTKEGRNQLYRTLATVVLLLVVLASLFLGSDYPGREYVRLVSFTALVVFYWRDFFLLRSIQKLYPFRRRIARKLRK